MIDLRYILASYLLRWSFDLIPKTDTKVRFAYGYVFTEMIPDKGMKKWPN